MLIICLVLGVDKMSLPNLQQKGEAAVHRLLVGFTDPALP